LTFELSTSKRGQSPHDILYTNMAERSTLIMEQGNEFRNWIPAYIRFRLQITRQTDVITVTPLDK